MSPPFARCSNNCSVPWRTAWIQRPLGVNARIMLSRLLILLSACVLQAAGAAQETAGTEDLTPNGRGAYVSISGAMDTYAILSGELATGKARRPEVRNLGRSLAAAHRENSERTLAAARALGMDAPEPAMMPMHWDMMRGLRRTSNSRFDRLFLRQQLRVHEMMLALHRNYAANGDAPALREVAAAAVPTIERHLAELRPLAD